MTDTSISGKFPSFSTEEELVALLEEGMNSGDAIEMTPLEWQRLKDEVEQDAMLYREAS